MKEYLQITVPDVWKNHERLAKVTVEYEWELKDGKKLSYRTFHREDDNLYKIRDLATREMEGRYRSLFKALPLVYYPDWCSVKFTIQSDGTIVYRADDFGDYHDTKILG